MIGEEGVELCVVVGVGEGEGFIVCGCVGWWCFDRCFEQDENMYHTAQIGGELLSS